MISPTDNNPDTNGTPDDSVDPEEEFLLISEETTYGHHPELRLDNGWRDCFQFCCDHCNEVLMTVQTFDPMKEVFPVVRLTPSDAGSTIMIHCANCNLFTEYDPEEWS